MFSYLKLFDFQPDFEKEHRSLLALKCPSDTHSRDSFPNFFHCLHFKAHLRPSGKSLTVTDINLRLGIQMAEAIFCRLKVVKTKWICKW